jgi:hypothetical protein
LSSKTTENESTSFTDNRKNCGNISNKIEGNNNTVSQTDNNQNSVNQKAKGIRFIDNRENIGNFDNTIKGDGNSVTQQTKNQNSVNPNCGNEDIERGNENNSTEENAETRCCEKLTKYLKCLDPFTSTIVSIGTIIGVILTFLYNHFYKT